MKTIIEITYEDDINKAFALSYIRHIIENRGDIIGKIGENAKWAVVVHPEETKEREFKARMQKVSQEFDSGIQIQHGQAITEITNDFAKMKEEIKVINSKILTLYNVVDPFGLARRMKRIVEPLEPLEGDINDYIDEE